MMKIILLILTLCAVANCVTYSCPGQSNNQPIITTEPLLTKTTTNGKLYYIDGDGLIEPGLYIAHLYGTPYEMGLAYGSLLAVQIQNLVNQTFAYFDSQIDQYTDKIDPDLQPLVAEGVEAILDAVYDLAAPYIPARYIEEMKGIADGSGVDYKDIRNVAMIPEALKAGCSMVGAWGNAVTKDYDNTLVQLRALDWDTNGPFQQYPVVLVYHPNSDNGHTFSVLSWAGLVGAITGYADADVGICEKVWYGYDGKYSHRGTPFTFLLRDILQFDETRQEAINRMESTHRTCAIFIGVGDSQSNEMNIIQYSYENVTVYDSEDYPSNSAHPTLTDIIYVDKHVQPSNDPCLGEILEYNQGNITAPFLFQQTSALAQTGDMHIAVYDYKNRYMYVSNAQIYEPEKTQIMAYDRPFVRLDMNELFSEKLEKKKKKQQKLNK